MNIYWKKSLVVLGLLLFIIVACKKPDLNKIAGGTWNPNLAAPIGYAEFSIKDILAVKDANDIVEFDEQTGEMALSYRGEIASIGVDAIVQISNMNQNMSLNCTDMGAIPVPNFNGTAQNSQNDALNFPVSNGVTLNDVTMDQGTMDINISTNFQHNFTVAFTFLDILEGGSTLTRTTNINYNGGNSSANISIPLANDVFDLTANGTGTNTSRIQVDITINGTGQPILGTETFDITFGLNNLKIKDATGYFGQQTLTSASDSVLLKVFENATSGVFSLTNPFLDFTVENSFGIPVSLNITNLKSINTQTGNTLSLTNPNLNNISIPAAPSMGQKSITAIPQLNNTNTANIDQLITQTPKYLNYTVDALANPNGNQGLNFLDKNSKLVVKADLKLPLKGYAYDFSLADTLPFKFDQDLDFVQSVMLRLNATNGFPIDFATNVFFLDSNNVNVFDLSPNSIKVLDGAPVDNTGKVSSSLNKITDINLTASQIAKLKKAHKIVLYAEAATTNAPNQDVTVYDYYKLNLKLGIQTVLKQNF